jgi:hypothetical protein
MPRALKMIMLVGTLLVPLALPSVSGQRDEVGGLALQLEKLAAELALNSFDHFRGWEGEISDQEQAVLFKSESFAASARLFVRLSQEQSGYFRSGYLRTNLYNAFVYLARSFRELEEEMRRAGVMPYALTDCRRILDRMENIFSQWPAADNLAYLHQKYVKASDETVYMIERKAAGIYVRHPFKNLESIYRFNYDLRRGKDPWASLVEVSQDTLEKMRIGEMIDLSFEGNLVIEQSTRPNRSVYLIQNRKKRGITNPQVLQRFGGWDRVFEVPAEVIESYQEGEPIR